MPEPLSLAGLLLVAGALIGAAAASHPVLWPVWSAPRDERLRIVGAHRLAWTMLNAGFLIATLVTAGGLAALAVAQAGDAGLTAALAAVHRCLRRRGWAVVRRARHPLAHHTGPR